MLEANITDAVLTPATLAKVNLKNLDSNICIDDTFDVTSFRGSDLGSHAGSRKKTHGVSVDSHDLTIRHSLLTWRAVACEIGNAPNING